MSKETEVVETQEVEETSTETVDESTTNDIFKQIEQAVEKKTKAETSSKEGIEEDIDDTLEEDEEIEEEGEDEEDVEEEEETDEGGDLKALQEKIRTLEEALAKLKEEDLKAEEENAKELEGPDTGTQFDNELEVDMEKMPELEIEDLTEEQFDEMLESPEKFNEVLRERYVKIYNKAVESAIRAIPHVVEGRLKETVGSVPISALQETFYMLNEDLDTDKGREAVVATFNEIVKENKEAGKEESYRGIFRRLAEETRKRKKVGSKKGGTEKAPTVKTGSGGGPVNRSRKNKKKKQSIADEYSNWLK